MTTRYPRRWLALLVHPRDVVASSSKRRVVKQTLGSGALNLLQLRSTESDCDDDVLAAGRILAELVTDYQPVLADQTPLDRSATRLVVNHGSFEIAMKAGASGWHLKERIVMGKPAHELQRDVQNARSRNVIVGCSVHSVEAAIVASACGFDYIQVGTMFSTVSHPEKSQASLLEGPDLLRRIQRAWQATRSGTATEASCPPLIAVGGINTNDHVDQVLQAGADGVAVIRGILAHNKPDEAARSYRKWLDQSSHFSEATEHDK